MIQKGTLLNVVDNSGAKRAECIHLYSGYQRRYAKIGDLVKVAIKKVAKKNPELLKVKKGSVSKAVIVSTKTFVKSFSGDKRLYKINGVVLLSDQTKYIGTRVFISLDSFLKKTKYLRLISMSNGVIY